MQCTCCQDIADKLLLLLLLLMLLLQGLPDDIQEGAEEAMRQLLYESAATEEAKARGEIFLRTYYRLLRRSVGKGSRSAVVEDLVAIAKFCRR